MSNYKLLPAFLVLALQSANAFSAEGTLSNEYLQGKWTSGGKDACTSGNASYVIFHQNHTLEAGRGGSVSTVGFWELADEQVLLHLLVAPSPGREAHPFYQGRYYYQHMSPKVLGMQADSIEFTHDTGALSGQAQTLTRCR